MARFANDKHPSGCYFFVYSKTEDLWITRNTLDMKMVKYTG